MTSLLAYAQKNIINLYAWADDLPQEILRDFEKRTGIHVNSLSYDSNETMFAKIKSTRTQQFDIIEPSNYYLKLLANQGLITKLDRKRLKGLERIDSKFFSGDYSSYGVPFYFGATGILVNKRFHDPSEIHQWRDLAKAKYTNKLLLLNEPREVYSMALLALGHNPNTENIAQIDEAHRYLKKMLPNIKLFNSDAHLNLFVDEDVTLGMMWNADAARAQAENPSLQFIYPEDGFVIYVDNYAILEDAPHKENAYRFLSFLLQPDVAARISRLTGYAITNRSAMQHLPESMRKNATFYPSQAILKHGYLQKSIPPKLMRYYDKHWQALKIAH